MVRLSNGVVGFVNIVMLLGSLACLGSSLWFYTHHGARGGAGTTVCQEVVQRPLLILGLCLFVVSVIGLIGSCGRIRSLLRIYLLLLVVLVIGLVGFTVFTVAVTNRGVGEAVSGRGYKEYRLGDYSHWLQKYVVNQKNWGKIRACLVDANVCDIDINFSPGGATESAQDFFKKSLSPTQLGCCKPPTHCGFEFKNSTFWTVPKGPVSQVDADCTAWSNDQRVLCYDCKSCKAGVLDNIKRQWRLLTLVDLIILVLVLVLITIGCCALKNDRSSQHRSGYP